MYNGSICCNPESNGLINNLDIHGQGQLDKIGMDRFIGGLANNADADQNVHRKDIKDILSLPVPLHQRCSD